MAYPNGFARITIQGTAFQETEIWNTGFNIINSPSINIDIPTLERYASIVASRWETFFGVIGAGFRFPETHYTNSIKASHIGLNGYVVGNNVVEEFFEPPLRGQGFSPYPPGQLAMVVTLRSQVRKGPGALGRMYIPSPIANVQEDGLVGSQFISDFSREFSKFINGVNQDLNDGELVGLTSPAGDGVQSAVTSFRIDNRIDTQRRRTNNLPASGAFVPVTN